MAEVAASLPSVGFGAVAAIAIRAIVQAFKINKDAGGVRDGLQASRITELERRMDDEQQECHARLDMIHAKLVTLAQVNIHVTAELKVHAPESPTLEWAKLALHRAFPLDLNTPADMAAKAQKLNGSGGK